MTATELIVGVATRRLLRWVKFPSPVTVAVGLRWWQAGPIFVIDLTDVHGKGLWTTGAGRICRTEDVGERATFFFPFGDTQAGHRASLESLNRLRAEYPPVFGVAP